MKNKLPVIFLLLCLISYLIFKKFDSNNLKVLYIGDALTYNSIVSYLNSFDTNKYIYDNITYKEINNDIKTNSYRVIKDELLYLNQLIGNADVIVLNANNFKYMLKCRKNERIITEYNDILKKELDLLIKSINMITETEIFVIGNYCNNYNQILNSDDYIYINLENISDINKIIVKTLNN